MSTLTTTQKQTPPAIIAAILGVSALASLFLFWLVYYHAPADAADTRLAFLPAVNALLNGLAAIALVIGFWHIKAGRIRQHLTFMSTAFVFSAMFLVTYITNHALHGDMRFHGQGFVRGVYFPLLISHITLSVIALPMILITFSLPDRPVSGATPVFPHHVPDLALCLGHRGHRLRDVGCVSLKTGDETRDPDRHRRPGGFRQNDAGAASL
jgi:putative membrane protein